MDSTLCIGTVELPDRRHRVVPALVVDEGRALGASSAIVQKLELQDLPHLIEEALCIFLSVPNRARFADMLHSRRDHLR